MRNKVNEWQELRLKKDIEKILDVITHNTTTNTFAIVELSFSLLLIVIEQAIPNQNNVQSIAINTTLVCLISISLLVFIFIIGKQLLHIIRNHNTKYQTFSTQELIMIFDHDVCNYVMMADSYCQMLNESIRNNQSSDINNFYFIESWYYLNKVKSKLNLMSFNISAVFSKDGNNNSISLYRLSNIVSIIESTSRSLIELEESKKISIREYECIKNENKANNESYVRFLKKVCETYKEFKCTAIPIENNS